MKDETKKAFAKLADYEVEADAALQELETLAILCIDDNEDNIFRQGYYIAAVRRDETISQLIKDNEELKKRNEFLEMRIEDLLKSSKLRDESPF
jgi:chaperonin cofactor prefoldin